MVWQAVIIDRWLFWTAFLLLAYAYAGYPIVTWARAVLRPRPSCRADVEPTVTVIVVAHNEEDRIGPRIENLLALDYPRSKLNILIASDGSADETVARARLYADAGVRVRAFAEWRGKAAVLNDVVPSARGAIVVLADARQRFEAGAVRALMADFADPSVGAVSGELMLTPSRGGAAVGEGTCVYWRYEKFIRRNESRASSTVGTTGAIYAIRRGLFEPIPNDTILDDVAIPLRIVRRNYRVLFEPGARAYDCASASTSDEFARKVRTIAGTFQLFARERWLFNPFANALWFETISHKALRLGAPLLLALVLAANVALVDVPVYRWLLAGQILFYLAALGGRASEHARLRLSLLTVPYTFCLLNWAAVVGFVRYVTGDQRPTWGRGTALARGSVEGGALRPGEPVAPAA